MKLYFLFKGFENRSPEHLETLIKEHGPVAAIPRNSVIMVRHHLEGSEYSAFIYDKNGKVHFVGFEFFVFFNRQDRTFGPEFVSGSEIGPFISFARHEETYLDLYNRLESKTWAFLNAIRDYHYLKTYKAEVNPFRHIQDSEALHKIRMTKSFRYMEHRGFEEFMFRFRSKRDYRKMSQIDFSMRLKGVPAPTKIHFDFTKAGIVPSRLAAIIGKNGVGKTRCLKGLKDLLVDGNQYRKVVAVNLYRSTNSPRTPEYASLNIDPRDPISFASTIAGIVERRRRHDYFDAIEILRDILKTQIKCSDVRICDADGEWISIWDHPPYERFIATGGAKFYKENGEEFILSQGQVCLLSIAVLLLLYVEKNTIVLFDEPETYLHPNYIVKLANLLERLLERTDSVAVLATHSIFLVREMPRTSVYTLTEDGDGVRMGSPQTETLGATLDRLAYEFFSDEDVQKNYEDFVRRTKAKLKKQKPKVRAKKISELPADLASKILSND